MFPELTNLLPQERLHALRGDYYLRLGTLAAIVLALLALIHGGLLVPPYLYLQEQISVRETYLNELSRERAAGGFEELSARLDAFAENANQLLELQSTPQASAAFAAVLALPHPGIVLNAFTFTRPQAKNDGRMQVSGVASTRESLRQYVAALRSLPFASAADLPLSAYAKESDISFTITLIGTLTP